MGVLIFAVVLVALYTFDGIPFKLLFGLFAVVAIVEALSFLKKKHTINETLLLVVEVLLLVGCIVFATQINIKSFWYIVLGVPGYDIFAYLFGKIFGGKVFKKSRPFPRISKNKTWEGTILGLLMAVALVVIKIAYDGSFASDWMFLLCGPLALVGDLYESYIKRRFGIKDSNEIVMKNKFLSKLELCVGGANGHGGFLDMIDSVALTCSALMIISCLT